MRSRRFPQRSTMATPQFSAPTGANSHVEHRGRQWHFVRTDVLRQHRRKWSIQCANGRQSNERAGDRYLDHRPQEHGDCDGRTAVFAPQPTRTPLAARCSPSTVARSPTSRSTSGSPAGLGLFLLVGARSVALQRARTVRGALSAQLRAHFDLCQERRLLPALRGNHAHHGGLDSPCRTRLGQLPGCVRSAPAATRYRADAQREHIRDHGDGPPAGPGCDAVGRIGTG